MTRLWHLSLWQIWFNGEMDSGIQLPHKDLNVTAIWMSHVVSQWIKRKWSGVPTVRHINKEICETQKHSVTVLFKRTVQLQHQSD
jgi:hypothetical protein